MSKRERMVTVRTTPGLVAELDSLAQQSGCSRSELIRWVIAQACREGRMPEDWATVAGVEHGEEGTDGTH